MMAAAADLAPREDIPQAAGHPQHVGDGDAAAVAALFAADQGSVGVVEEGDEPLQVPGRGKQAVLQELAGEFGNQ
jgi:hypothetical protein